MQVTANTIGTIATPALYCAIRTNPIPPKVRTANVILATKRNIFISFTSFLFCVPDILDEHIGKKFHEKATRIFTLVAFSVGFGFYKNTVIANPPLKKTAFSKVFVYKPNGGGQSSKCEHLK